MNGNNTRLGGSPVPYAWEMIIMSFGALMGILSPDLAMIIVAIFGFGQIVASFAFASLVKQARKEEENA